jgi:hypothetical protein
MLRGERHPIAQNGLCLLLGEVMTFANSAARCFSVMVT